VVTSARTGPVGLVPGCREATPGPLAPAGRGGRGGGGVRESQDLAGRFSRPGTGLVGLNLVVVALLIVAVALGLNNFGAAIAIGVSGVDRRTELKVATVFGLCDVVMPATGMLIGTGLAGPLGSAARWAGAGILLATAVWGLIEALRGGEDAPTVWRGWRLLVSGAALSLDDLAVGLALGTVRYPIVLAVALFGLMSFVMSVIGLKLGKKLGVAAGEHGEVAGAVILIGIAGAMALGWL
jgi:manganese efflux pump family protein